MVMTLERPRALLGSETEAFGSDPSSDKTYHFRYKVVELEDLVASHRRDLTPNPSYPKELQPRIRDRAASKAQIEGMAAHLNPRVLLHDSGFIDTGPMIVGKDNVVESGNGRSLALMMAAEAFPANYDRYRAMLTTVSDKYGFDKSQVSEMKQPVLVRERLTDTDRVRFTREANVGAVMGMSPYEQAVQDAKRLSPEVVGQLEVGEDQTIDQALRARANDFIISHFVSSVPANERATIADAKGQVNSQGLQRLKLALFGKTYTGDAGQKLTRIFGESADPYVKQMESAMFATLPDMAKATGLIASGARDKDLDVAPDVAEVVDTYASLKAQGLSVQDYLKQIQMFDERLTPAQKQLLEHLDDIGRKPKLLREFFRDAAEKVIASPPPGQGSLLGMERVSKEEVLNGIINRQREDLGKPPIAAAPALSRRQELAAANTTRAPGPAGVGSTVGRDQPSDKREPSPGYPTLAPSTSVQVGLAGIGPSHAQVKMLEEFGTAPGAGGQKQLMVDVEALKAQEEAKPLKGQMGFGGEVVGEVKPSAVAAPKERLTIVRGASGWCIKDAETGQHVWASSDFGAFNRKNAEDTLIYLNKRIASGHGPNFETLAEHEAKGYPERKATPKPTLTKAPEPPKTEYGSFADLVQSYRDDWMNLGISTAKDEPAADFRKKVDQAALSRGLRDVLEGYSNLDEARESLEMFRDREVVGFTARGIAVTPAMLGQAIRIQTRYQTLETTKRGAIAAPRGKRVEPTAKPAARPTPKPPPAALVKSGKEPWQMTRKEWTEALFKVDDLTLRQLKREFAGRPANSYVGTEPTGDDIAAWRRFGHKWVDVMAEKPQGFDDGHTGVVKKALREGKPVPHQVLAEYPELERPELTESQWVRAPHDIDQLRVAWPTLTFENHGGRIVPSGAFVTREFAERWWNIAQGTRAEQAPELHSLLLKEQAKGKRHPALAKDQAAKYDWRDRKLTCAFCHQEISTSHPMQTLEAQMIGHLRKEHGMTKDAARMGFRQMMSDQRKVPVGNVLHGSLGLTASTGTLKKQRPAGRQKPGRPRLSR